MGLTTLLESDLAEIISLDGLWRFRLADQAEREMTVPGAWEAQIEDRITDGPARYSRTFTLPRMAERIMLHCEAIAFACAVWVNGQWVGAHTGMWSAFQLDVTEQVQLGQNEIVIEVHKPGRRYPLRQTLAGFLPDVANTFGGIWQSISLRLFDRAAFSEVRLIAREGNLELSGQWHDLPNPLKRSSWAVYVYVFDEAMNHVLDVAVVASDENGRFSVHRTLDATQPWQIDSPNRYWLVCELVDRDRDHDRAIAKITRRFGFRDIATQQDRILLAGQPQSLRGVLSWGWDAKTYCPTPSAQRVRADFARARSMGFNLFKLCLFVPDETLFEIADEEGMVLWLELPLWLPEMSDALRELTLREYEGILRRVHHHPSILLVSLGCELNREADAPFLAQLRALVAHWMPNTLRCDNSGSAEAYGGVVTDNNDFYDYHFYSELHYFQPLIDHFRRPYQPNKPWIFGEFSDADTLRDFARLRAMPKGAPWWLHGPFTFQREELSWICESEKRLREADITDGGAELTRIARLQAQAVRKFIFERVRLNFPYGGYVVTGWQDTPIASSGMIDDFGELKFDAVTWRSFNSDNALSLVRGRQRSWVNGGDRPNHRDPYVFWSGEPLDLSLVFSALSSEVEQVQVSYSAGGKVLQLVESHCEVGEALSLGLVVGQSTDAFTEGKLIVSLLSKDNCLCEFTWGLTGVPSLALNHILLRRKDIEVGIDAALMERIRAGHTQAVWVRDATAFTRNMPFWRESIHVFAPHPYWNGLPQQGYADEHFFSVATELALTIPHLHQWLTQDCLCEDGELEIRPIWRRFDARAMTWAEYLLEVRYGQGRLYLSTLRFAGGLGNQPNSFETNPMGCALLHRMMMLCEQAPADLII